MSARRRRHSSTVGLDPEGRIRTGSGVDVAGDGFAARDVAIREAVVQADAVALAATDVQQAQRAIDLGMDFEPGAGLRRVLRATGMSAAGTTESERDWLVVAPGLGHLLLILEYCVSRGRVAEMYRDEVGTEGADGADGGASTSTTGAAGGARAVHAVIARRGTHGDYDVRLDLAGVAVGGGRTYGGSTAGSTRSTVGADSRSVAVLLRPQLRQLSRLSLLMLTRAVESFATMTPQDVVSTYEPGAAEAAVLAARRAQQQQEFVQGGSSANPRAAALLATQKKEEGKVWRLSAAAARLGQFVVPPEA